MKTISISVLAVLFFSGCTSNDISTLSKNECRKQGFKYKTKKDLIIEMANMTFNPFVTKEHRIKF